MLIKKLKKSGKFYNVTFRIPFEELPEGIDPSQINSYCGKF